MTVFLGGSLVCLFNTEIEVAECISQNSLRMIPAIVFPPTAQFNLQNTLRELYPHKEADVSMDYLH